MSSRSSHTERTATQARQPSLHAVTLASIRRVNPRIRLLTLALPYTIHFLPGQWLDVHIPTLPRAGGFTITSAPSSAIARTSAPSFGSVPKIKTTSPYLELAVQDSPSNPPAAWLWRPEHEILGSSLLVRVGGNFVWPPPVQSLLDRSNELRKGSVKRLILVAGGVGINPLMSILTHLSENPDEMPSKVLFAYGTKVTHSSTSEEILFVPRLRKIFTEKPQEGKEVQLFLTGAALAGSTLAELSGEAGMKVHYRRMRHQDLLGALGPFEERQSTVVYVCGPPAMTDEMVNRLRKVEGMDPEKVLCEKWW